ncbi:MAG: hypothetical protein V1725_04070 [archaeon]
MCCEKCSKMGGLLFFLFGIIFLLQNLNVWNFWGIQWYTVLFVLMGLGMICMASCKECQTPKKKK